SFSLVLDDVGIAADDGDHHLTAVAERLLQADAGSDHAHPGGNRRIRGLLAAEATKELVDVVGDSHYSADVDDEAAEAFHAGALAGVNQYGRVRRLDDRRPEHGVVGLQAGAIEDRRKLPAAGDEDVPLT